MRNAMLTIIGVMTAGLKMKAQSQTLGILEAKNIRADINAYGKLFNRNGSNAGFEVPKG